MAAAEARAVWQRTAGRYFIQEDAKRAPKLACCSSTSSLLYKQPETRSGNTTDENESFLLPNEKSSYSDLSSDSRWWLQLQPDHIYQTGLTNSHKFVENQDGSSINSMSKESFEFVEMDAVHDQLNEFKMKIEKTGELPWWQMAETDDFSSFLSKRSHDSIKNYHLSSNQCQKSNDSNPISWNTKFHQDLKEKRVLEIDSSKAKILEALQHSQTRAREAEKAAKEAYAEKDHIMKLLLKQASQLFACKQWIHLLQLENLYYQIKNSKNNLPISPRGVPSKTGKPHKKMKKRRRKDGVGRYEDDIGKYAVVFAMGLGLVGAGLLLGWTVGWMLI